MDGWFVAGLVLLAVAAFVTIGVTILRIWRVRAQKEAEGSIASAQGAASSVGLQTPRFYLSLALILAAVVIVLFSDDSQARATSTGVIGLLAGFWFGSKDS